MKNQCGVKSIKKQCAGEFDAVHITKAQREGGGMVPRILNLAVPPVKSPLNKGICGQHGRAGLVEKRRTFCNCWQSNQNSAVL